MGNMWKTEEKMETKIVLGLDGENGQVNGNYYPNTPMYFFVRLAMGSWQRILVRNPKNRTA